jgi:hypothetical protein
LKSEKERLGEAFVYKNFEETAGLKAKWEAMGEEEKK